MKFAPIVLLFLKLTGAVHHVEDNDDDDDDDTEEDEVGVRSGFDMFMRRLPGSLMLATSGNETGTIMGTWSTNAVTSTVFEFYQEESVIANGHYFGGWITGGQSYFMHVQEQMSFKAVEGNLHTSATAGAHEASKERLDVDLLMTKLWTSAILRDNIVTVFGFILNRPNNLLPADLYASLMILYNAIRLRRIHTLDVLPVLKRMSFSPPQEQFIVLFEELQRHAPAYLKSVIGVWVDALTEQRIDLNPIIRPGGGPSEVDFLASLEPSVLNVLEEPILFKQETTERASKTLMVLMGPLFSYVFAGLYDKSIKLSQPLFALILLHLPLDKIVPQKDETERFVVDALRLNAIKHWDEVVGTLSDADILDPFRLAKAVLQSIANNEHIDQQVQQDSLYILPYIKASTSTYAAENYGIMSEVVGSPSIKFKLLLDHITRLTYTQDMVDLKDRLLDYILNGYIAVDSAITGFIRYDYTTPYDVMIAILTRIQRRLPNLSSDMLGTVKALQVHLVFHKVLSQTKRHFPADLIHFPCLLDAFYNPGLPGKVRRISNSLSGLLGEERIDWESLIGDMPVAFCTTPRQCVLAVLSKAIDKNIITDNRIVRLVQKLFNILDENGNVKDTTEPVKCEQMMPTVQTPSTTTPAAQINQRVSKYEPMIPTMPNVQGSTTGAPIAQVNTNASTPEPMIPTVQMSTIAAPSAQVNTRANQSELPTVEIPSTTISVAQVNTSEIQSQSVMSTVQTRSTTATIEQVNTSSTSQSEEMIPPVQTPGTTISVAQGYTSASQTEPMMPTVQTSATTAPVAQVNSSVSETEPVMPKVQTSTIALPITQAYTSTSQFEPMMPTVQTPGTTTPVAQVNTSVSQTEVVMLKLLTSTITVPVAQIYTSASEFEPMIPTVQTITTAAPVTLVNAVKAPRQMRIFSSPDIPVTLPNVMPPTFLPHDFLNSTVPINASLLDIIPKVPQLQLVFEIIENNTFPELHQLVKYFRNTTREKALLVLLKSLLHSIPAGSHTTLVISIVHYINVLAVNFKLPPIIDIPKIYPPPPPGTDFPAINPSIFCLPANFEQRESLLPYTTPFTPKDILMKPIRDFITRADLLNVLGDDFRPSEYPTKFLLLRAILERAIVVHVVREDFYLHDLLTGYLEYLKHQAVKTRPSINWIVLLDALPHPKDDHEYQYFSTLRDFIMSAAMETYTETFELRRYATRGQLLQNCLRHLLSIKQIKERPDLVAAIKYFVDKVYFDGFGAKPVEYIIIKEQIIRRTIDLQKAFQAIDLNKLNRQARKALKGVYKFFEKEFQPPIHLSNYNLMKHKTKGEWLKAYFIYLADHPAVSSKARHSISVIIPYILLTGPGAENVD